jgi:hypothetical protein
MTHPATPIDLRCATRRTALTTIGTLSLLALSACAASAQGDGSRSITLSDAQLNSELARHFPLTRRLSSGLLELSLSNPNVRLMPERNGLGTRIALGVTERLMGTRYDGSMDLNYGLRFDAATRTIRLQQVHVNSVDFASVPPAYRSEFSRQAPRLAEQLLEGLALYEVPREKLDLLGGLGFTVNDLRVTAQGLRIGLLPSLGGAANRPVR